MTEKCSELAGTGVTVSGLGGHDLSVTAMSLSGVVPLTPLFRCRLKVCVVLTLKPPHPGEPPVGVAAIVNVAAVELAVQDPVLRDSTLPKRGHFPRLN